MKKDKTVEVLNKLLEINNDRLEGYETATNETDELELKALFARLSKTSLRCRYELIDEITILGGEPVEGTKTSGKFFRAWMDVKAELSGHDRNAILSSCEFGEDKAIAAYKNVLINDIMHLSTKLLTLVRTQYVLLKADHDTIHSLRDAFMYKSESHDESSGSRASI
jgi:uncharacterized protein (TIGR02284 family)